MAVPANEDSAGSEASTQAQPEERDDDAQCPLVSDRRVGVIGLAVEREAGMRMDTRHVPLFIGKGGRKLELPGKGDLYGAERGGRRSLVRDDKAGRDSGAGRDHRRALAADSAAVLEEAARLVEDRRRDGENVHAPALFSR